MISYPVTNCISLLCLRFGGGIHDFPALKSSKQAAECAASQPEAEGTCEMTLRGHLRVGFHFILF